MSDFDKFFADKLGAEGQYPRQEKNWRALSKRLDAFDTGLQQQVGQTNRFLRYWQAAAACAIVAASWLTWKLASVQNDNAVLRREVAVLQEKNNIATQEIALLQQRSPNQPASLSAPAGSDMTEHSSASQPESKSTTQGRSSLMSGNTNFGKTITNRYDVAAVVADTAASNGNQPFVSLNTPENASDSIVAGVRVPSNIPGRLSTADSIFQTIATLLPDSIHHAPSRPLLPTQTAADIPSKIIEPVRDPSRFRVGIQILAGMPLPREKGVSLLAGQGITAEYNLWRNFWLTASADWLRYDVSTEKYFPKFHSPHHPPPPGGSPHEKLVKVESTQRQQQYGLGLRYSLPLHSWVRPAVRAAYTLTRTSPELVTFRFEHQGPGGPPGPPPPQYRVRKTESQMLENVWRFGVGLEHETPSWVFGVWADYSKNFAASDATFDALLLRAGLQYRFN